MKTSGTFIWVGVFILLCCINPLVLWAQTEFDDDFEDGNIDGWSIVGGSAGPSTEFAHGGSYSMRTWDNAVALVERENFTALAGKYEAWFYIDDEYEGDGNISIQNNGQNQYYISCRPIGTDNPMLVVMKILGGFPYELAQVPATFNRYEWFKCTVIRTNNGFILVYINDELQISVSDTDIMVSGAFRVGGWKEAFVDDVCFSPLEDIDIIELTEIEINGISHTPDYTRVQVGDELVFRGVVNDIYGNPRANYSVGVEDPVTMINTTILTDEQGIFEYSPSFLVQVVSPFRFNFIADNTESYSFFARDLGYLFSDMYIDVKNTGEDSYDLTLLINDNSYSTWTIYPGDSLELYRIEDIPYPGTNTGPGMRYKLEYINNSTLEEFDIALNPFFEYGDRSLEGWILNPTPDDMVSNTNSYLLSYDGTDLYTDSQYRWYLASEDPEVKNISIQNGGSFIDIVIEHGSTAGIDWGLLFGGGAEITAGCGSFVGYKIECSAGCEASAGIQVHACLGVCSPLEPIYELGCGLRCGTISGGQMSCLAGAAVGIGAGVAVEGGGSAGISVDLLNFPDPVQND